MPRGGQQRERRAELLPKIAQAFVDLGYRRATTAELARRCDVQETILYRLWADKKAMFLAAIEYVYEFSEQTWLRLLASDAGGGAAWRLLEFEARHHGEFGHYRIIFTGLAEIDDPDIRDALRRMFARFHRFLMAQILASRPIPSRFASPEAGRNAAPLSADATAWAAIGLGTIANIARELKLLSNEQRCGLVGEVGRELLKGVGE